MNSPKLRLSAAAIAAFSVIFSAIFAAPAGASLADHPQPAKLDTSLPKPPGKSPAAPGSAAPPLAPAPAAQTRPPSLTLPPNPPPAAPLPPAAAPPSSPPSAPLPKAYQPAPGSAPGSAPADRTVPGREEILALARKGLLDSALRLCSISLDASPQDPFLLLMMGKLSPGGKESSEYFKKAIKAGTGSPEAEESLFRLGQFHYATGKYHFAIPFFRDYLRLFPKGDWKEPAAYWMGNACLSLAQGRPDRIAYLDSGAAWFQKLLDRTRPEDYYHPMALEGLAKALAFKGDREGAWKSAKSALEKAPEEVQSPLLLLAAQLRQGVDRHEEKAYMALVVGRYPQSPEARYLRKVNAGLDTAKWKSGSGLPRPSPIAKDSLRALPDASGSQAMVPPRPTTMPIKPADTAAKALLPKPPAAGRTFTLQVGAFSQAANAKAMMANLAKVGVVAELVESGRAGKPIFQVRVGRFASMDEALEFGKTRLKPHRFLSQPVSIAP